MLDHPPPARQFAAILADLRTESAASTGALAALHALLLTVLGRLLTRLDDLFAQWQSGQLPPHPARASHPERAPRQLYPAPLRQPRPRVRATRPRRASAPAPRPRAANHPQSGLARQRPATIHPAPPIIPPPRSRPPPGRELRGWPMGQGMLISLRYHYNIHSPVAA